MKNFKLSFATIAALLFICAFMSSCGKGNQGSPSGNDTHNIKFTITVVGGVAADNAGLINLVFNAAGSNTKTIWSVNGVQQSNQTVLQFDGKSFPPGQTTKLIIQSLVPVTEPNANLRFANVQSVHAYTISYKAEIDGKVKNDDENVTISGTNGYAHTYDY